MSIKVTSNVAGAKDALKTLRKLDPEARKQFLKDAKQIAAPIVNEAKICLPRQNLVGHEIPVGR
jgi:mRNA-degrading endonuclease RelE of RelBE toxin-antitoxin system